MSYNKINYIVAFYIGKNRGYDHYKHKFVYDPLFFVREHVKFVETCNSNIFPTFVFNDDIPDSIKTDIIDLCPNIEIIFRPNNGFSYGAWNDAIIKNIDLYDYFFIIEDDYIPTSADFCEPFLNKISDIVPYVCS